MNTDVRLQTLFLGPLQVSGGHLGLWVAHKYWNREMKVKADPVRFVTEQVLTKHGGHLIKLRLTRLRQTTMSHRRGASEFHDSDV